MTKYALAALGLVVITAVIIEDQLARRALRQFWRDRDGRRSFI